MSDTTKGIALFFVTMLILSILDMMAKYISGMAPPFATTAWRYLIMFLCALFVSVRKDDVRRSFCLLKSPVLILRGALLGLFGSFMLLALRLCPLSITVSIVFTMPLFLLVLSKVMLKEEVRLYQWVTVCIGFLGMCIILRPSNVFSLEGVIYALIAMASYGLFLALTRSLSKTYSPDDLMFTTTAVACLANAVLSFVDGQDLFTATPFTDGGYLLLLVAIGLISYFASVLVIHAFALADASILAPFNYMQLAFTLLISMLVFGETLDMLTWAGIMAIFLSGAGQGYLAGRNERRSRC